VHHLSTVGAIRPDLSDIDMTELYTNWTVQSAKNAAKLLEKHGFLDQVKDYT
jgi:hypothetical protein